MRAPAFWFTPPDAPALRARLLAPVAFLAAKATAVRVAKAGGYRASVPVICVGNINVGGTGKTPMTMALAQALTAAGHRPAIVTRGYGGSLKGPLQVDEAVHRAGEVGDEALLLSAFAPVFKAVDRAAGVLMAEAAHDVIILDDGHQNPSVIKDISIVVVNARQGFGNGRVMPAGPLREPVGTGLARADVLLSIGSASDHERLNANWPLTLPQMTGEIVPLPTGMPWPGLRVLAFAGIGQPEKFFNTLRHAGAEVVKTQPLDDHQPLTDALMARLAQEAKAQNAQLVTTEKDAVRLPDAFRRQVLTFPVRLDVQDWQPLRDVITAKGLHIQI